jgi:asparagine synthase (glutamine-hydrolysing)
MCGIAGCLALAPEADPDQNWVAGALECINHRGPDDDGIYTDADVTLGFRRLAIIDLSAAGHQPMRSADGRYWMVFNGEIYNYIELGQELRDQGVALRSSGDSEVLLETYARVGKEVVHRLRGMYAFAIWDTWTHELFCARDPFGIKPFYYCVERGPGTVREGQDNGAAAPPFAAGQSNGGPFGAGQFGTGQPATGQPVTGHPAGEHLGDGPFGDGPFGGEYPGTTGAGAGTSTAGVQDAGSRPRGGRHAAPASGGGAADREGDSPPADWFAPTQPPARRPGRHAAGEPRHEGVTHQEGPAWAVSAEGAARGSAADGAPQAFSAAPPQARASAAGPPAGGAPGMVDLRLRFASERKALASPGQLRGLDPDALRRYLAFQYVPAPDTMTPPIRVLPPGHAMIVRPGAQPDVYRFWRADLRPAKVPNDETPQRILAAMRDSVAVHLRSDAPLGAFLSGGIDSAAICALAAEHRPDLLTFTVGFEREGYSEIDRAQETAAALGVRSIPYLISPEEFFHHLPQIIWHLDDPMADAAAVPLWFVAREASKHVKVVLSGEGSDELFGGYAIYHQPGVVRAGEKLPDWGRAPLKKAAGMIPAGVKGRGFLERTSTPLRRRYIGNARVFTDGEIDKITRPGPASPWDVTDPVYDQAEHAELDDTSTMQLVDINTWLAGDILVKADRMTMAHSLELRVPFLDREVLAVAARLARVEKIGAGTTKLSLRAAMSEVLPRAAAERAKLGFPVPIGHWLTGEAYGFAEQLLREAQTDEWINRQEALKLLEGLRAGEPGVEWRHVWVLIVFSLWYRIYVEGAYDPVALGWEHAAGVPR